MLFIQKKLLLIIILITSIGFSVSAQEKRFSIKVTSGTIEDVFNQIEQQSNYTIFYKVGQIDVSSEITIEAKNITVAQLLEKVLINSNASYAIYGNMIVITPKTVKKAIERPVVTGTIVSATDNKPLSGVNIVQEGSGNGTISDINGRYTLDVDSTNVTLVYSFVGYLTRRIPFNGQSVIDLSMYMDIAMLDDVIVIGYGSQKKGDVTGAITSLSGKELSDKGYISFDQMIQGKAAGVEVINNSGLPGAGVSIKIRGVGTLYNTDPLYVIDGFPFRGNGDEQTNPLSMINPNDIESIEILKDASAAAIYGTRAANGVILINTRKGRTGKPKISFNSYMGISAPHRKMDLLNTKEYLDLLKDIQHNANPSKPLEELLPPKLWSNGNFTDYALTDRTDWQNEIFRVGKLQDHSLAISGGNGFFNYALSGGYTKHEGILIGYNYERYSFRSNTEFNISSKIKAGENMSLAYSNTDPIDASLFDAALRIPPYLPVYDNSNLGGFSKSTSIDDLNDAFNPVALVRLANKVNRSFRMIGNLYTSIEILNGLTYKINFGLDYTNGYNFSFIKENENGNIKSPSTLRESYAWGITPTIEHTLEYTNTNEKRSFSILAGNNLPVKASGRYLAVEGKGFSNEEIQVLPVADNTKIDGNATGAWQSVLISYFGRINYAYHNRYLLTANFRRDASPRFSPKNRWGNFPSFSAGWRVSEENFFRENFPKISNFKLRAGWGKSGSDLIGDYAYQSSLHSTNIYYIFGVPQKPVKGVTINSLPSPFAKWETASTANLGIDIGLFNNKLTLVSDFFIKNTRNILVQVPIPPSIGMGLNDGGGDPTVNAASVTNKGMETTLAFQNNIGKLSYFLSLNATFIENKVISLGNGQPLFDGVFNGGYPVTKTETGKPIGYFYGFVADKVYSTQQEINEDNASAAEVSGNPEARYQDAAKPGDIRFQDLDGDGHITDKDRKMIGNPNPDFIYGLTLKLNYKGFNFSLSASGVYGNEIFSSFYVYWLEGMIRPFNSSKDVLRRWKQEGDKTDIPRAVANDPNKNTRPSTRFIKDGSYLRIKNISFGYTLPARVLSKILNSNTNLGVYITSQNLFTFSSYNKYDPEIGAQYSGDSQHYNLRRGIDSGQYPQPRTFLVGFQLNF